MCMYVFLCFDCFTACCCVFCASVLFLCTDSLSSCLIFVSSVWASLPEIKRWNGIYLGPVAADFSWLARLSREVPVVAFCAPHGHNLRRLERPAIERILAHRVPRAADRQHLPTIAEIILKQLTYLYTWGELRVAW